MSMPRSLPLLAALLLALVAVAAPAGAATSDWAATDQTRVRLIAASDTLGDGHDLRLGLEFHLDEGWKVYWRSPGDAGYPPRVDWSGSENLADVDMRWPAPLRFSVVGLETLGYKKDVVFPLAVRAENPDAPLRLRARVDYLTCAEICIPYTANLALDLPAGPAAPAEEAHLIDRYRARVPGDGAAHGLDLVRAVVPGDPTDGDSQVLTVTATARTPFQAPDLYVEGPPELIPGKPAVTLVDGGRTAHLAVPVAGLRDLPDGARLSGRDLTLTLVDGDRSAEARLNVATGAAPAATPGGAMADGRGLLAILALAVLGGLILNLMPCVLPVLSIKVLGVMGHGGGDRGRVRLSFLASAAGILVSFLALAGTLIALKAGGMAVGWGIQFQHPWFLTAMMLVVGLFACNLWGFFEVRLPGWLSSVGSTGNGSHGLGGHFLGGVFATLLATPCSAPFLGTAVGFAFAAGPAEILAVFAALGLGLALPYLGVAALPGLATRLPRPGPWMDKLRIVLGLALAATGVWLLTVLAAQVGKDTAGVVGALVVVGGAALYLRHRRPALARAAWAGAAVAGLLALAVPAVVGPQAAGPAARAKADKDLWAPFDRAAIPARVAAGQTVFVDVTADWCITCQVNKAVILGDADVRARLDGGTVLAMQADWTRPDDAIAAYLASFGRYGIPFNAVYGPGAPDGLALPELLTPAIVLEAIDKAGQTRVSER